MPSTTKYRARQPQRHSDTVTHYSRQSVKPRHASQWFITIPLRSHQIEAVLYHMVWCGVVCVVCVVCVVWYVWYGTQNTPGSCTPWPRGSAAHRSRRQVPSKALQENAEHWIRSLMLLAPQTPHHTPQHNTTQENAGNTQNISKQWDK